MKSFLAFNLSNCLLVVLIISSAQPAGTERSTIGRSPKVISAKDKADINELFKTSIGIRYYRMEFDNRDAYGAFELSDPIVNALRKGYQLDHDLVAGQTYKSYQPNLAFWYFINKAGSLEGVLGKANAARFNAILNKYTGGK
jgi:hypothetical protein